MRDVIVETTTSLDGFVAPLDGAPDHRGGPEDPGLVERKLEVLAQPNTHVMGRVTYEEMSSYWPMSDHPYAAPMNEQPKVVFSKTLQDAPWQHSRIASGDLADEIDALRNEPGGPIIAWGGAAFLQALSRSHLVDEYRVVISPIALGAGKPLFGDMPHPIALELIEARSYPTGAVLHVYRPV